MEIKEKLTQDKKSSWISLTGYRTLFVLKLLIEKNCSIDEISECLQQSELLNKSTSKDTIRFTINTLKNAGCEINRPSKSNGYKYELVNNPFDFSFSEDELNSFINFRENLAINLSWKKVFELNELYSKIKKLCSSKETQELINSTKPLFNIDKQVVDDVEKAINLSKKIQIKYYSPKNGDENIDIVPSKISYDNGNLYLCAYNFKYGSTSLFNFDRIKKVNTIYLDDKYKKENNYEVVYKIMGEAVHTFEKKDYETILEQNPNEITVKAIVENEFIFIQRILLFGVDFKIILPDSFKEKIINKIKKIQKEYEND